MEAVRHIAAAALFLIVLSGLHFSSAKDFEFKDRRQAIFAESLTDYQVTFPSRIDDAGRFISFHLPFHLPSSDNRRRKRDLDDHDVHFNVTINRQHHIIRAKANYDLLAPSMITETRSGQESIWNHRLEMRSKDHCHFKGHIEGHPGSSVAIATCDGLHGLLRTNDGDYFIEPVKGHPLDGSKQPHLVYKALHPTIQSNSTDTGTCGVSGEAVATRSNEDSGNAETPQPKRRKKRSTSLERTVEVLVVVDSKMLEFYQEDDIDTYILTIMNMVTTVYHDASLGNAVNIALVRILKLETDEPGLKINHHADHTLKSFCKWQKKINPPDDKHPNHHDVAILITRYDICSRMNEPCSTLGLAQVSGMCQRHRSCNVNEDTGLSLAFTIAHELGHNFDMRHDGSSNGCFPDVDHQQFVMSPQMNGGSKPMMWSECSKRSITNFLDRDWGYCLDDEPTDHPFKLPLAPPGVMYDADHQCRLQYNQEASHCGGLDDICRTLWCNVDGRCMTRLEAAAPGTICGENAWCSGGRCVTIGDEEVAVNGQWGQWSAWSDCSRSCGGGVSSAQRHCDHPPPRNGGKYCLGERKRFRICNVDDCPEDGKDFRSLQCKDFNDIPYRGKFRKWEVVHKTDPLSICQLHCKPKKKFFSVMLKDMVTDGTPCVAGHRDMCIAGRCRKIGCDWKIDSPAVEDHCGVCHGDGTTCKMVNQNFDKKNGRGYVEATVIPEGARNIRVEEVAEANNYLAIKSDEDKYYLNGGWYIQWSGDYEAAGTVIHYHRDGNKESFNAIGPLKEPLHIMLLFQSDNPGVNIEFTVPNENSTDGRKPEFFWKYLDWTHCTSSCGGGHQRSEVVCVEKEAGIVEEQFCNSTTKPDDMQKSCNAHMCPAKWWAGPWQHCSVTCGDGGLHQRTVLCIRTVGPDNQVALEDEECSSFPKPTEVENCHQQKPCHTEIGRWETGPWNVTCDTDPCQVQSREVKCAGGSCDNAKKPVTIQQCGQVKCGTWQSSEWSTCTSTCGSGFQIRTVTCVDGEACKEDQKPESKQQCHLRACPSPKRKRAKKKSKKDARNSIKKQTNPVPDGLRAMNKMTTTIPRATKMHRWMPKLWGKCSNECGAGMKLREVVCVDMESSSVVDSALCNGLVEPERTESCYDQECAEWRVGNWDQCSATCGNGIQSRLVKCPDGEICDVDEKPLTQRLCNIGPCLSWISGSWSECSLSCNGGSQTRSVVCVDLVTNNAAVGCMDDLKPSPQQPCNTQKCEIKDAMSSRKRCSQDLMSHTMCKTLLRMGRCQQDYVRRKCCRSCKSHSHHKPRPRITS